MADSKKNRDIQNIFIVLSSALFFAAIVAVFFLFYYGPSGSYYAENALLSPQILERMRSFDRQKNGKMVRFEFDRIEFTYYSIPNGKTLHIPVSIETYNSFFSKVASLKSLEKVTLKVQDLFHTAHPTYLTISLQAMDGAQNTREKVFQMIEMVKEDYFRVHLIDEKGDWVYFYLAGFYEEMNHLFISADHTYEM